MPSRRRVQHTGSRHMGRDIEDREDARELLLLCLLQPRLQAGGAGQAAMPWGMHALCQGAILRNNVCARKMKSQKKQNSMKQFDLDEYLNNPSRKVVTRDGRCVKIHCTNYNSPQPIIAEIEGSAYSSSFWRNGRVLSHEDSPGDLLLRQFWLTRTGLFVEISIKGFVKRRRNRYEMDKSRG